ncbi:LysM peptidoglycan-binding domain-containing protein [Actinomycetospora termitidis]|uniref:LysM peptidoglycan-binding domain-containing protein n=1 Tax=Actinomycetospora termitidis TaxID=3053470 RepID=A0ABT7M6W7_9PSEU|nr:LysM peptidoglycan-binding domain-containing protein [Actinomycetospora sp. Odt1-22]MDL5156413.1 LysM peptidoglycan-binding domain-containing protein [Actinomycetospora sp. Odt1-22]
MVRRRRAVAVVVLGAVLVALLALAVRLGGEVAAVAPGDGPVPTGSTVAVVAPGETLLEVAERVAPGADPAAVAERIREANRLSSSLVAPGRPLVVPAGR